MDQRKTLIIIASVTIFLAAAVGVGIWLLDPPDGLAETETAVPTDDAGFDPLEYIRSNGDEGDEGLVEPDDNGLIDVVYGEADAEADAGEAADGEADADEAAPADGEADPTAVAEVPARTIGTADARTDEEEGARAAAAAETRRDSAADTGRIDSREATEVEPRQVRVTEYWIQVIASQSLDRVRELQDDLETRGLPGRITSAEVSGEMFYRLRVGPYMDRGEAEKFLGWIRGIDGFQPAQIWEEYPVRTVVAG